MNMGNFGSQYHVYNLRGGTLLSKEEFIQIFNISQEDIDNRINQYIEECVSLYKEQMHLNEEELASFYETAKRINVLEKIDFLLDSEGEICMVLNCPDWPGMWYYQEVVKLK